MQPLLWRAQKSWPWLSRSTWHHLWSGQSRTVKLLRKVCIFVQPPSRNQLPLAISCSPINQLMCFFIFILFLFLFFLLPLLLADTVRLRWSTTLYCLTAHTWHQFCPPSDIEISEAVQWLSQPDASEQPMNVGSSLAWESCRRFLTNWRLPALQYLCSRSCILYMLLMTVLHHKQLPLFLFNCVYV